MVLMPSAAFLLLAGAVLALALGGLAWWTSRGPRSPARSVDGFRDAMRAIQPRTRRR